MGYFYDAMQGYEVDGDDAVVSGSAAAGAGGARPAAAQPTRLTLVGDDEPSTGPRPGADTPMELAGSDVDEHRACARRSDTDGEGRRAFARCSPGFDDRLVAALAPASVMAEEYRAIRTGLLARWRQRTGLIHTITSATPQEGKTLTSLNLGFSFAELDARRTVVVEADLRMGQFARLLGLGDGPGVADLLTGEATLAQSVRAVGRRGLHVICAGRSVGNEAVQLLAGERAKRLLASLRQQYDHVIIDTPPVLALADAGILGALSDDVLLIARMNRTPRPLIEQAVRTLERYNAPVAGVIATDQPRQRKSYRSYYARGDYSLRQRADQRRKAA